MTDLATTRRRPSSRIFILAGNYEQALMYARKAMLSPSMWTYVDSQEQLRGIENPRIVRTGTWYDRLDLEQLGLMIMSKQR